MEADFLSWLILIADRSSWSSVLSYGTLCGLEIFSSFPDDAPHGMLGAPGIDHCQSCSLCVCVFVWGFGKSGINKPIGLVYSVCLCVCAGVENAGAVCV